MAINAEEVRRSALRELLTRAQAALGERFVGLGTLRSDDGGSSGGDEMDVASEQAEVETNARLLEHRWSTLAALNEALGRHRQGLYGVCDECGEEISLERLRVIPFAAYCIDCQDDRENKKAVGSERIESSAQNDL